MHANQNDSALLRFLHLDKRPNKRDDQLVQYKSLLLLKGMWQKREGQLYRMPCDSDAAKQSIVHMPIIRPNSAADETHSHNSFPATHVTDLGLSKNIKWIIAQTNNGRRKHSQNTHQQDCSRICPLHPCHLTPVLTELCNAFCFLRRTAINMDKRSSIWMAWPCMKRGDHGCRARTLPAVDVASCRESNGWWVQRTKSQALIPVTIAVLA